ncbi:hypothetical protein D3C84_1188880 [compost metagenome]
MPTGSLFCTSCISSCRLLPSFSTSPPCFMLMARPSAGLPSKRMPNDGGVTNWRSTVAMSPRRKLLPPALSGVSAMAATEP